MAITKHVQHVKSNQTVTTKVDNVDVISPKLPSYNDLKDGEIAVNYHKDYETLSIRNDNNGIVTFPNSNAVATMIEDAMSGAQDALTFDSTPTANSDNPVTSQGIKTYVDNGDKIQAITTYQTSTPVVVNDTHDQAISKLIKIIDENETTTAGSLTELNNTKAEIEDLSDVAFTGSYNDLSDKPTIPTVNDGTLTIQKNSTTVATFSANQSGNKTANITVPTKVSELTNDSGFITSFTETDPTVPTHVKNITEQDITNWNGKGTVSSVGMTVPTGLNVSGSPIRESGTLAVTFASGYSIPTTAKQNNWDTAYTNNHTHSNKSVLDGITSTKVSEWDNKQNALTFDNAPTANSINPVTSGGIKTALDGKQDKMLIVTATVTGGDGTTYYNATLDKTHSEIVAAMQSNKNVYIYVPSMFGGAYIQMTQITGTNTNAFFVVIGDELWYCHTSTDDDDNSCIIHKFDYLTGEEIQDFITSVWYDTTNKIVKRQDYAGNVSNVLTFDTTPTANSTNPVTSGGIKTYVDNGDKIQAITTYQTSTPVAVNDTHDQAISKLIKIIADNERTTAASLTDLDTTKADIASLSSYATSANYDSNAKKIYLKHDNTVLSEIDATAFIKDGMVDTVTVGNGTGNNADVTCLIITFNTDAGKSNIELPISQIFNANNYYTSSQVDDLLPSAGTGLTEDANHAFNHTNSVTANTNNVFKTFTYDAQGHVTAGTDASEIDFTVLEGTTLSSSFLNRCATNYTTGAQIADSGIDYDHASSFVPYTTLPYRTVTPQESIQPKI